MFNIGNYFKKFTQLENDSVTVKSSISLSIKEICGVEDVDFELKKGVLYIKGSPMVKSLIFIRKTALLERVSQVLPKTKVIDIR